MHTLGYEYQKIEPKYFKNFVVLVFVVNVKKNLLTKVFWSKINKSNENKSVYLA
jgi:hypothetical protein